MSDPNSEIANMRCEACRADAPQVTEPEMARRRLQVPQWEILEQDGANVCAAAFASIALRKPWPLPMRLGPSPKSRVIIPLC